MKNNLNSLVSIVLPIYNGEKYMRQSIESVINQTYKNWELIIIDDCSIDNTPIIAKEYADKDNRIRYYRNETNLKLPRGLNRGFSLSKGDYLTWTSDDNLYLPNALEVMIKTLIRNKVELVYASYDIIDENDKIIGETIAPDDSKRAILAWNCVGACFLYTRKVYEEIGEYNPDLFLVEDYEFWIRVCSKFEGIAIKEKLYRYRLHCDNLTSTAREGKIRRLGKEMLENNIYRFGKLDLKQKRNYYAQLSKLCDNKKEQKKYERKLMLFRVLAKMI